MQTADPRVVTNPRRVPSLSFGEAAELAYFGAKVLHPSTIAPAVEHGIPVRILNTRAPEGEGTRITAEAGRAPGQFAALAFKRDVTVVDITSTRMLDAYGFLRRVFEIFERHRTAVDVVTTSEVSVSVTVDDCRHLDAIAKALGELAQVSVEPGMALLCAVGDGLQAAPAAATRVIRILEGVPMRMISLAASRRNITVVLREADLAGAAHRPARGAVHMRVLIVGYGRMGRLVEEVARVQGFEVAGHVDVDGGDWAVPADVAIDFTTAAALAGNFERYLARRLPVVIGTTGWEAHREGFRARAAEARLGVVAAANFSIGVNVFEMLVAQAAGLMRTRGEYGAWLHEAHHAAKRDAPSGTALLLQDAMRAAGFERAVDVSSTRAGAIPGTHTIGFDGPSDTIELTHRTRDRRGFAAGALLAARWVQGRQGWFSMADVLAP